MKKLLLYSILKSAIEDYVDYRRVSGRTSTASINNIINFDHYCYRQYPQSLSLTQEMVDMWCQKRETELPSSHYTRIHPVIAFLNFALKRGYININIPTLPKYKKAPYIPHAFTQNELLEFFKACDTGKIKRRDIKLTIPVLFRLLYSSGIRTTEVIRLRKADVDLIDGILNIKHSKGYDQHFVVLHDSMLDLMRIYDIKISSIFPNRIFFFPYKSALNAFPALELRKYFKRFFPNTIDNVTPYQLRHNYATENINKWINTGFEFNKRLLYLSKSMGHRNTESTKRYFSITPSLTEYVKEVDNEFYNECISNIDEYEKNKS